MGQKCVGVLQNVLKNINTPLAAATATNANARIWKKIYSFKKSKLKNKTHCEYCLHEVNLNKYIIIIIKTIKYENKW